MSAQLNLFTRLFGRKREQHTPWQRFRENRQETGEILIEFLRQPADIEAVRAARRQVPQVSIVSFETWLRMKHLPALPPHTGAMHPLPPAPRHSDTLLTLPPTHHDPALHLPPEVRQEVFSQLGTVPAKPAPVQEDAIPGWARPEPLPEDEWLNSNVASVRVWVEPEPHATGALDALALLAAQRQDDGDTLEVPAYVKKRHAQRQESENA